MCIRDRSSAGISTSKEPTGLTRLDGKRPDSPLARGQARDMGHHSGQYACSVLPPCIRSFCCWSRRTCRLKEGGQVFLSPQSFIFVPIALETLGAIAAGSLEFLTEVGWRLSAATGDARETAFCICPSYWGLAIGTACFILRVETQR